MADDHAVSDRQAVADRQAIVGLALEVADDGLARGELPIGAVVLYGDEVIARAHTQEQALRRRIVHADLMALLDADTRLGLGRRRAPLTLAVSLEPCLMCLGAAMTLGVERVLFGLESPGDGAADLVRQWAPAPELPFFRRPAEIQGGILRSEAQSQFARYAALDSAPPAMRAWARDLAQLP